MKVVVKSRKYDDAMLVVESMGDGIVLLEWDTSDKEEYYFGGAYQICDVDMARELIAAIREVAKHKGWEV